MADAQPRPCKAAQRAALSLARMAAGGERLCLRHRENGSDFAFDIACPYTVVMQRRLFALP